jgi:hypothetical protein
MSLPPNWVAVAADDGDVRVRRMLLPGCNAGAVGLMVRLVFVACLPGALDSAGILLEQGHKRDNMGTACSPASPQQARQAAEASEAAAAAQRDADSNGSKSIGRRCEALQRGAAVRS